MDISKLRPAGTAIEMASGELLPLVLSYGLLYRLKAQKPQEYKRFFKALNDAGGKEADPIFNSLDILYTAHLCMSLRTGEQALSYEDFLACLPMDMESLGKAVQELIGPKKRTASGARSSEEPEKTDAE